MLHGRSDYELTYEPGGLGKYNPNGGWVITETKKLLITDIPESDEEAAAEWARAYIERDACQGVDEMRWDVDQDTGQLFAWPAFRSLDDK